MDDLVKSLREKANSWQPLRKPGEPGRRSPKAQRFWDAADEIERLRAVILDIARIVENPDDRALRRVRDVTDKHSSPFEAGEKDG